MQPQLHALEAVEEETIDEQFALVTNVDRLRLGGFQLYAARHRAEEDEKRDQPGQTNGIHNHSPLSWSQRGNHPGSWFTSG